MNKDMDAQFLCKDCKRYNLCNYYHRRKEDSYICKYFHLPSVENKGEWIEVVEEKFPNGEKQMWHYECSACGAREPLCPINKEHWEFCPNCGADMRGK